MKLFSPVLFTLAIPLASLSTAEQIVTLGDSLTFSYEAEFCFQETVTVFGFPTTIGDGFPPRVRNWIEILSNPAYRGDRFELGTRDSVSVDPPEDAPFDLYFRQSHNWAIPGLKVDGLRRFVTGDPTATFISLMGADAEFSTLSQVVSYSDFVAADFALTDFENQVQTIAERVVISIGGNDIRAVYGTIYDGNSAGTFVADFMADMVVIVERVQTLKPGIQIVLANVPHVGITPKVRASWPYDPVKTERVSAVLRDLNGQLAGLAATKNIGYADIYTATVRLIDPAPAKDLCIHGIPFGNTGTSNGSANPVWLNGPISKNFHPNTNGQVVIANEIVDAFNKHYQTGIAPLTSTEIHVNITPKDSPANLDMPFSQWATRFGATGITSDDSDGDGITAGVEFALGLNPVRRDSHKVTSGVVGNQMELAYPVRLPSSAQYTLTPGFSATLGSTFTPFAVLPTPEADGLLHARIPVGAGPGFLQLKATTP